MESIASRSKVLMKYTRTHTSWWLPQLKVDALQHRIIQPCGSNHKHGRHVAAWINRQCRFPRDVLMTVRAGYQIRCHTICSCMRRHNLAVMLQADPPHQPRVARPPSPAFWDRYALEDSWIRYVTYGSTSVLLSSTPRDLLYLPTAINMLGFVLLALLWTMTMTMNTKNIYGDEHCQNSWCCCCS